MGPDVDVFVSYARSDADRVGVLTADLERVSDRVWFDSHVTGGQQWWDMILQQIESCSLFVLAVSEESLRSEWCRVEAEWARDLGRPILPVRIDDIDIGVIPRWLRDRQIIPLTERTADSILAVVEAVIQLTRDPLPLPDPVPARPDMPAGPFDEEREKLARNELSPTDQSRLLLFLQTGLDDPKQHDEAAELLDVLAARHDVTKTVHDAATAALGTITDAPTPSIEPPPVSSPTVPLIQGRTPRTLMGHTDWVLGCAVAPDGTYIVSASDDQTLRIWDPETGRTIRTLEGHTGWVRGCAVAPDGTYIVSASNDQTLRIWDPETGRTIRTLEGHTGWVRGCAVAPDGTYIVSASGDNTLRIWDPETGDTIRPLEGHTHSVYGCAVAPDSTYIVSASDDNTLRIWDPETGDTIRTLEGHTHSVYGCAVAPDSSYIVSASDDNTLRIWNPETGDTTHTLTGHTNSVSGGVVALDNSYIVSASNDNTLRIWNPETGRTIRTLEGHTSSVRGCAVGPDSYIVSASNDNTLRRWQWLVSH